MKELTMVLITLRPVCDRLRASDQGLTAMVDLATLVACADGDIDESERSALYAAINTLLGDNLTERVTHQLVRSSIEHIGKVGAVQRAEEVGAALRERELGEDAVTFGAAIALVSRGVDPAERRVLDRVARAAGLDEGAVDAVLARLEQELAQGR